MKKYLYLILLILIISGCVSQKKCLQKFPPQETIIIKDSIVIKDTTIYSDIIMYDTILGDTVMVYKKIQSKGKILNIEPLCIDKSLARSCAWVNDNKLFLELIQKDTVIKRILKKAKIEKQRLREFYQSKYEKEVIKVKYIPKFYKFTFWFFIGLCGLTLIFIILKVKKILPF